MPRLQPLPPWPRPPCRGVQGNGEYIKYLTMWGVLYRFATASRRRNRFVPEGSAIGTAPGYQRLPPSG